MTAVQLTPEALQMAAVSLRRKRANDPWDGPNGMARPNQLPPSGSWRTWLIMAGRGYGKTRTGAEFIRREVQLGRMKRVALVGATASDVRDVMVEGESGLLACCQRAGFGAEYNPSRRRIKFANGAVAYTYSADEPNRLRGPQHDGAWADEIAAWRYVDAWDQLMFGLRLGTDPRVVATTTPRPIKLVRDLLSREASGAVAVTRGSTYDNRANLAEAFFEQIITRYEGTTLGRQELMGELVEDIDGALWNRSLIQHVAPDDVPELRKIVVAIDPATTFGEGSDETGLCVAGIAHDGTVYVLDAMGVRVSPGEWARMALALYRQRQADRIVAESNQGGEMVRGTLVNALAPGELRPRIELIRASRGKTVRAEPVVALYEQGRVRHVGAFPKAEDQMCAFPVATDHDDQVDALVHAITAVAIKQPLVGIY